MDSNNKNWQYEQPRCPESWYGEERRFYAKLIEVLDEIFSKYGRIDEKMLADGVVKKIKSITIIAGEVDRIENEQAAIEGGLGELQTAITIDSEGVHVYKNRERNEVMITDKSVDMVVGGTTYSRFLPGGAQFGKMRMWEPESGGLAFAPMNEVTSV